MLGRCELTAIGRELRECRVGDCAEDRITAPAHTILMIDDNPDDCEAFRRALIEANENYLYLEARDGVTGIASIEANRPNCILLNYSVAGLSGLDVLARIRATDAFLPVIMLIGEGDEATAMRALRKGAQNYLVNAALNAEVLHRAIIAAIEQAFLEREIHEQRRQIYTQKLALAETGLLNKAILHSAGVMIIATGRDGTILTFNPAAERALGYAADEVVGVHTPALWFDEAEIATHASKLAISHGAQMRGFDTLIYIPQLTGQETHEWTFICKNGRRFPVNLSTTPMRNDEDQTVGFLCIAEDITLRQEQERALKESEETFRTAVESAPNGMALIDPGGRFLKVNPALCTMLGYSADELMNMPLKSIPHPEEVDFDAESVSNLSRGQIDSYRVEMRLMHKSGRVIHAQLSMSLIRHHDGSAKYYVAQALDITDRIEMDRIRSEFISIVSHELRTPLTSIRGSLGLLAGHIVNELPETARKLVNIAYKNCERLILLINDILDIDKIASGQMRFDMRPETVGPLLEEAAASIRGYVEDFGVHLQLDPSAPDLMLKVDRERFIQVLNNLLSNAVKFSPKGGVVELRAEARENSVRILVSDHGPGIPPEFQDRLFNKFFQADASATRVKGGTGLGLHISRQIIERMGGQIGFDTKVGEGTTMWVELPLLTAQAAIPASEDTIPPELGPRVLVCEDDDRAAWLIQKMLTKEGFTADVVHSIAEARRQLKAVEYAAITLDLAFPVGNGIDFAREMNADPQMVQVPIVIVSGTERADSVDFGEKLGIVDWIVKPINRQHLVASIEKAAA